jgi:hypothetical protein
MSVRALVPLYRLEVNYLVRHGRRWSALEHLLLWACQSPRSAQELALQTDMPVRLISEGLVNLLRAGWVDLRSSDSGNTFSATAAGIAAAAKQVPDHLLETQRRSSQLYMERLSGEYFSIKELTVIRRGSPEFLQDDVIEPQYFTVSPLGPELVDRLPLRRDDTFERLRDTPKLVPGDLFAILDVGPGGIEGLPRRTPAAVGLALLAAMTRKQTALPAKAGPTMALPSIEAALGDPLKDRGALAPFLFSQDTLVIGGTEHLEAADALIRAAQRIVIIHSTFVGKNIQKLLPAVEVAARAGVQVHIHWGKKDDPEGIEANPSEMAARLAVTAIPADFRRNVHLGQNSTGSHAKIILADCGTREGFTVLLGSCNWLCSPFKSVEASVRTDDPALVAVISQKLAALLAPAVGQDLVVGQLLAIHAEAAAQPAPVSAHRAMVVSDQDHYAAVRDAMNDVGQGGTVLLGSHKFGHAGETTALDPMRAAAKQGANVKLFYSKVLPNFGAEAAAAKSTELAAGTIALHPTEDDMHAKFLSWGDFLLITSFNFLSASVNGNQRSGSEIGILLQGAGIAEAFVSGLEARGVQFALQPGSRKRKNRRRRRRPKKTLLP